MRTLEPAASALHNPIISLVLIFSLWKIFVICIALSSPGPGYDTSTSLLRHIAPAINHPLSHVTDDSFRRGSAPWTENLVRWDAIAMMQVAARGYLFEQEWAWGWGYTRIISLLAKGNDGRDATLTVESAIGIAVAHVSHLSSVLLLYATTRTVFPHPSDGPLAFVSAGLHVFSPAGIFLSAPYSESLFSLLSNWGYLHYAKSLRTDRFLHSWHHDAHKLIAGVIFAFSTTVRSNGLLHGLLFLYDAWILLYQIWCGKSGLSEVRRLFAVGLAGVLVAMGTLTPQYLAHCEFCRHDTGAEDPSSRPWCSRTVPSIYTWVQEHYWNVGPFNYWTLSNLPLFILAAPTLSILVASSLWALRTDAHGASRSHPKKDQDITSRCLTSFAIPQLVLAVLALTTYHVQIITRLASGYVVWYWWIASLICNRGGTTPVWKGWNLPKVIIRWMIIYAIVQGGLFASFLPPA